MYRAGARIYIGQHAYIRKAVPRGCAAIARPSCHYHAVPTSLHTRAYKCVGTHARKHSSPHAWLHACLNRRPIRMAMQTTPKHWWEACLRLRLRPSGLHSCR